MTTVFLHSSSTSQIHHETLLRSERLRKILKLNFFMKIYLHFVNIYIHVVTFGKIKLWAMNELNSLCDWVFVCLFENPIWLSLFPFFFNDATEFKIPSIQKYMPVNWKCHINSTTRTGRKTITNIPSESRLTSAAANALMKFKTFLLTFLHALIYSRVLLLLLAQLLFDIFYIHVHRFQF